MSDDETPTNDLADQQRAADPEPDDTTDFGESGSVTEADPADVAEQQRDVPEFEDDEPWP